MTIQLPPPPIETEDAILRIVGRTHPDPLEDLDRCRLALRLGWAAAIGGTATLKHFVTG